MSENNSAQEEFWAGKFGDDYITRNKGVGLFSANVKMFAEIFSKIEPINSITEYGCNIGMNFRAIKTLLPECKLRGVEINENAVEIVRNELPDVEICQKSILKNDSVKVELTFTKGVLIHVAPSQLPKIYDNLYSNSSKYILVAEYYNPTPVAMPYRGHQNKLFKRDFAGELLDLYPNLGLLSYGFCYHRDNHFPQDDITWFLLQKKPL